MSHIPPIPRRAADQVHRAALHHVPPLVSPAPPRMPAWPSPPPPCLATRGPHPVAVALGSLGFALLLVGLLFFFHVMFGA